MKYIVTWILFWSQNVYTNYDILGRHTPAGLTDSPAGKYIRPQNEEKVIRKEFTNRDSAFMYYEFAKYWKFQDSLDLLYAPQTMMFLESVKDARIDSFDQNTVHYFDKLINDKKRDAMQKGLFIVNNH